MDDFGIFNPRLVQQVKEDWERAKTEVRRVTAPILDEAGRIIEGVFPSSTKGPTTPLDGVTWRRVAEDEEMLRGRLERIITDLAVVKQQTVTLDGPSGAASFVVRVVLTDGTIWQARVPVSAVSRATEAELRLWALRLAGKVPQ